MAGSCPVVVAQWQSTGCATQVFWVQFPVTAGLFTFFYFVSKDLNLFYVDWCVLDHSDWCVILGTWSFVLLTDWSRK